MSLHAHYDLDIILYISPLECLPPQLESSEPPTGSPRVFRVLTPHEQILSLLRSPVVISSPRTPYSFLCLALSMQATSAYQSALPADDDRQNRFVNLHDDESGHQLSMRERAASQPPRSSNQPFLQPSPSLGRGNPAWANAPRYLNPPGGMPQSVPTRSSSFSATPLGSSLSAMRESSFASTFEDDESEALSDTYDDRYVSPTRGRSYAIDLTRSRSQSLAATRPVAVGSPFSSSLGSWDEQGTQPQGIPGRFGDIKPPGAGSRYGSYGPIGRTSSNTGNGFGRSPSQQLVDPSNMSPFVRDIGQIVLDEGSAFREIWPGARDENGGNSGTTSRRHSVSVVQPRRPQIVGFNAPGMQGDDEPISRPSVFTQGSHGGRSSLMLSDDDLAVDLGGLSLGKDGPGPVSSYMPPSQPSSLPAFNPSRSPPTGQDRHSPYRALNLNIPHPIGTPSENGGSPAVQQGDFGLRQHQQHFQPSPNLARYVPGQGIKYVGVPESPGAYRSPVSPTHMQRQNSLFGAPLQRRPSNADQPAALNDLGRGVPLHSVPASCPLFVVEFKAGRTDLFYSMDPNLHIQEGDLVLVEADRGKDLGKVVNATITLAEVEAIQAHQSAMDGPISPGGTTMGAPVGKKEINPKMIYGKATAQDTQYVYAFPLLSPLTSV